MNVPDIEVEVTVRPVLTVAPPRLLAVMRGVRFGLTDRGEVGLSFGAYVAEGLGAPQFLDAEVATVVIAAYQVGDVSRLEGKPCWVTLHNGRLLFDLPCLI
jgi:hypothetical protein